MKHIILPMALSISLMALSAVPAHAQIRRSSPAAAPASAAATTPGARPRNTLRVFIGPVFEGGQRSQTVTRTRSTTVTGMTGTAPNTTSSASASAPVTEYSSGGDGLGIMFGVDGTWWAADRFGLGAGLFGAYVGSGQTTNVPHLSGRALGDYAGSVSSGMTTATSETITVNPNVQTGTGAGAGVPGPGGNYQVTIAPSVAGGAGGADTRVNTIYAGFTLPSAQGAAPAAPGAFTLTSGVTTAPNQNFGTPTGGASFTHSRSVFLTDVTLHGDYALIDTPAGNLSFFGGFTIPNGFMNTSFNAKTTGTNDTATQVVTTTSGTGAVYTTTTNYKLNEMYSSNASFLAVGPVIGLNADYLMGNGLRLYSQLGYAPVLVGSATANTLTTRNNQTTVTVAYTSGTAGAGDPAAGTDTYVLGQNIPGQAVGALTGSSMIGSVGLGFGFAGLNLFAEGTARSYSLTQVGPELLYGLKLGLDFGF